MADRALNAYASRARLAPFSTEDLPSSWSETFTAARTLQLREANALSANHEWARQVERRAQMIGKLGGDEELARAYAAIPLHKVKRLREAATEGRLDDSFDWRGIDPWERESFFTVRTFERNFPGLVPDDAGLMALSAQEAFEARATEQPIIERGSGFAAFTGQMVGWMQDPLQAATTVIGGGASAAKSVLGRVLGNAGRQGAVALATEIPLQAQVYAYKRQIESPWTFKDSAMNVLAAGGGGAVLGGALSGAEEGLRAVLRGYRERVASGQVQPTPDMIQAEATLEDALPTLEANPLATVPDSEQIHLQALETAREQVEAGRPVDVADQVRAAEQPDALGQAMPRATDPAALVSIDPLELHVDARTFQFKTGGDAEGVTGALRDVETFDRRLAGVALVWERADGQRFIADGHQRVGLARRAIAAGQDPAEVQLNGFILREVDGISAAEARRTAAAKNMAEGTGGPLDAAKILRELGPAGEAALPPLPPRSALVRQARGLAALGEEEFLQVVNGVIDERFGAIVGSATAEPKLQAAMIQVLKRAQPANETQARAIVDQVRTQGLETRTTSDLFGEQSFSESLYLERAQVLDEALRQMRSDRAVFGGLVANQERITAGAGNQLDRQGNLARQQEAADVAAQISIRANAVGALSDALQAAASKLKAGASAASAGRDFLKAARREILQGDRPGRAAGKAGQRGQAAGAAPELTEPRIGRPVRLAGATQEDRALQLRAFIAKQRGRTIDQIYEVAGAHQGLLRSAADEFATDFRGEVVVKNPAVKERAKIEEKMVRKGYTDTGRLTDVVRIGFITRTPEQAAQLVRLLSARFELLDEGLNVTGMGYLDHKALVRFKDGTVAEVQLWSQPIYEAKKIGHKWYEQSREMTPEEAATPEGKALREKLEEDSRTLYAQAVADSSPEWRKVALQGLPEDMRARVLAALESGPAPSPARVQTGSGGAAGKASKNAAREISTPDSSTSMGTTRDQASASSGTKKASSPPSGETLTTAGRPSQLKNLSAIDAPPRGIIQRVDDPHSAQPEASRTGTVADEDYEGVMSQFAALQDDLGAQLKVTNVVDGVPVERHAAAVLDELDTLEESLERVRICSTPPRGAP